MLHTSEGSCIWGDQQLPPRLRVREVLDVSEMAAAVVEDDEQTYLMVSVGVDGDRAGRACWICAPASERALECVRSHRATPWTLLLHSSTGTVVRWWREGSGDFAESVICCADLRDPGTAAA